MAKARSRSWMGSIVGLVAMLLVTNAWSYETIEQSIRVPINDLSGQLRLMTGRICRPSDVERPRLVVINHGSSTIAADRPGLPLAGCNNEAVRWFLDRHYAVVHVWRLGYGATGGPWTEGFAHCTAADYYNAGIETARQISAIVDYSVSLPRVDPNGVIVVGHSGGGWGSIAYDGIPHSHVSALINMAGGRGGHYRGRDNSNCGGDQLVGAVRLFGKASSTPMLWIYADNDSYFGPRLAQEMAAAYASAGGKLRFVRAPSAGGDGHGLFFDDDGSKIWGPLVQSYLSDDIRAGLPAK